MTVTAKNQRKLALVLLAILGIFLLLVGGKENQKEPLSVSPNIEATQYKVSSTDPISDLENKLAETLSKIYGAGTVSVQITAKSTGRKEFAVDIQRTSRTSTEDNETVNQQTTELQEQFTIVQQNQNGAEQAIVVESLSPEITGVLIVASGAHSAVVQERLLHAAAVALQISTHQIIVVPGEEA